MATSTVTTKNKTYRQGWNDALEKAAKLSEKQDDMEMYPFNFADKIRGLKK